MLTHNKRVSEPREGRRDLLLLGITLTISWQLLQKHVHLTRECRGSRHGPGQFSGSRSTDPRTSQDGHKQKSVVTALVWISICKICWCGGVLNKTIFSTSHGNKVYVLMEVVTCLPISKIKSLKFSKSPFLKKILFIYFLRGEGREKERETNIDVREKH